MVVTSVLHVAAGSPSEGSINQDKERDDTQT